MLYHLIKNVMLYSLKLYCLILSFIMIHFTIEKDVIFDCMVVFNCLIAYRIAMYSLL